MSSTFLKIVACIFMLIDHIGFCLLPQYTVLRIIGRLAFPIFAFQIAVGYAHTHDKKKYTIRMLIFAIISELPLLFFRNISGYPGWKANIGFTFFIALLCLKIIDLTKEKKNYFISLLLFLLIEAGYLLDVEYGFYGILLCITFYLFPFRSENKIDYTNLFMMVIVYCYITVVYVITYRTNVIQYYCILALIPILLYNGKKGINLKYFFYVFYPLHLFLLGIIHYFFI